MIIKYVNDTCALLFMFRGDGYSIIYLRSVSLQKQSALCGCCTQCVHDVIFSVVCFSNWFPLPSTCSHPSSRAPSLMSRHWRVSRDRVTSRDTSWHVSLDCRRVSPCVAQLASEIFLAANEIFSSRLQGQKAITEVTVKVRLIIYQLSGFDLTSDTGHKDEERSGAVELF